MNRQSFDLTPIEGLRIYKKRSKPSLHRNGSASSSMSSASVATAPSISLSSTTLASSDSIDQLTPSSSQDSFHIPLPPSFELGRARRHHQARHDSWQISQRLVGRAEDAFEELLWQGGDVEEAEIRVRIAREEEEKCRRRVDRAALDITALKRKERAAHAAELSCAGVPGEPWRSSPPAARRRPMPTLDEVPFAEGCSRRSPSKSFAFRKLRAEEEGAAARRAARKAAEEATAMEAEREIAAAAETMMEEVRKRVELLQAMDIGEEQGQNRQRAEQRHHHQPPPDRLPPSMLPPSMSTTSVRACGCGMLCLCSAVAGLL